MKRIDSITSGAFRAKRMRVLSRNTGCYERRFRRKCYNDAVSGTFPRAIFDFVSITLPSGLGGGARIRFKSD